MEDVYIINGGKRLEGKIKLSGAKNVALKTIIAALLFDGQVILKNIPRINDVFELLHLIIELGGQAEFSEKNTVIINGTNLSKNRVDLLHASKIRVSFMFFAPLVHKFGDCYIPNPGGCRLGARPIDRVVEGMKQLDIKVNYDSSSGYYYALMKDKPSGQYLFDKPSHTGTELLIMISVFSGSKVVINNPASEPEIDELIAFLNQGGAKITKEKNKIIVSGVKKLKQDKPFSIQSDRNEAVTYAIMALATKGMVILSPIKEEPIKAFIEQVKKIGAHVEKIDEETWKFQYIKTLKSTEIETAPHPGFMTDWQPPWALLMTQATDQSVVKERIFENRFAYVEELKKLGAKIEYLDNKISQPEKYFYFNYDKNKTYRQVIQINGNSQLHGAVLNIADLRAGATLVIGALVAKSESVVQGASILERGYENFVKKVKNLGGQIKKV